MFQPFFHPLQHSLINYAPPAEGGPLIKSIQRSIITIPADEYSATLAISEVNLNSSIITHLGQSMPTTYVSKNLTRIAFFDSTTVKATRYFVDPARDVLTSFEVIEFFPSFIKSKEDLYQAILAGHVLEDFTISEINLLKSILIVRGINPDRDPNLTGLFLRYHLLNSTTIRAERAGSDGSIFIAFTVLEFN